jgi:hypothetical protein
MASPSRTEQPDFIRRQYEFAAHIRDPENRPAPGEVEERRMAIYRELLFNNVESFMAGSFPVLRKILDDARWNSLIRNYFSRHKSRTPLFLEMPREFLTWLESERGDQDGDLPFLRELAHYEWVELALSIAEESLDLPGVDSNGDLLKGIPVLSPLAWHLAYNFPVHRIGPGFLPDRPGDSPTFLVVYRDRDYEVGFLETNPVTKRLLELLDEDAGETGETLLLRIARELNHPNPDIVIQGGAEILENMKRKDIILGTKRL